MLTRQEVSSIITKNGFPEYRAKQILHAIYKEGISDFSAMAVLPKNLRNFLIENVPVFCFSVAREVVSKTGDTVKTLFKLKDGSLMEGVLMKFSDGRNSVCVSSQVGCGLKCAFCATGTMGFTRNLTAEEIADQVLYFDQMLRRDGSEVTNVIFMGMGEPMLNYDAVLASIRMMNDPDGLGIGARKITISTSGVIPGIQKLSKEPLQINLAVSLHAPNQALRESFMPIARAYKLPDLMQAIADYIKTTHRRVSYEYVMLKDINDAPELAEQLGKLIAGQSCHVNLIPYNQTYLGFSNAGKSRIDRFAEIVESFKVPVTVRVSLGQDISAACGQLATICGTPCSPR